RGTCGDVLQPAFSPDTLRDRVAIVTGASQGIGRAVALELAAVGAHVVACSRRADALDVVADAVRAKGRRALAVACDVGDAAQVDAAVARTLDEFGRIDLLVNNAGYRIRARLEDLPRAEWAKYGITVNAVAPGPTETEGVLEVWKTPAMIAQASREVPLQRLARPEEIAWAVIYLASDAANFMTGETMYVSGGPRVANRED